MKKALLLFLFCSFLTSLAYTQVASRDAGPIALHQASKTKLSIYPNPTTSYFQLTDTDDVSQIILFNVVGKRMKSFEYMEDEKYSVLDLPDGMYLIQFVGHNGKIVSTRRLSKRW